MFNSALARTLEELRMNFIPDAKRLTYGLICSLNHVTENIIQYLPLLSSLLFAHSLVVAMTEGDLSQMDQVEQLILILGDLSESLTELFLKGIRLTRRSPYTNSLIT